MTDFDAELWTREMRAAVDEICRTGRQLLDDHKATLTDAAEKARQWHLDQRVEQERVALGRITERLATIESAVADGHAAVRGGGEFSSEDGDVLDRCAARIAEQLSTLPDDFLVVRQCALDLLRWHHRFVAEESGERVERYRQSYAQLLESASKFQTQVTGLREHLLRRTRDAAVSPEINRLVSSLDQYTAASETAHAFVRSVVDPPMELTFHDTKAFLSDWSRLEPEQQARLGTELNDCCQFLLYDRSRFYTSVREIHRPLQDGVDAIRYVLSFGDRRIVFTMDEDPVFHQLIVTLLRITDAQNLEGTIGELDEVLYDGFLDA